MLTGFCKNIFKSVPLGLLIMLGLLACGGGESGGGTYPVVAPADHSLSPTTIIVGNIGPIFTESGGTARINYGALKTAGVKILAVACYKNPSRRDIPLPNSSGSGSTSGLGDSYAQRLYTYEIPLSDQQAATKARLTATFPKTEYSVSVPCDVLADGSDNPNPEIIGALDPVIK